MNDTSQGYYRIESLDPERLRQLCIEKEWYTKGTVEAYNAMLTSAKDATVSVGEDLRIAVSKLIEIAENIFSVSETDYTIPMIVRELDKITIKYLATPYDGDI
jgi:hypothetical protein